MVDGYEHSKYGPQPPLSRKLVNQRVGRIVRVFKWGVSEELVAAAVPHTYGAYLMSENAPTPIIPKCDLVDECQAIQQQTGREQQALISLHHRRERCREVMRELSAFNSRFLTACEERRFTHKEATGYRDEGVQIIRRAAATLRQEDFEETWQRVEENAQDFLNSNAMRDKAKSLPLRGAIQIVGGALKGDDVAETILQVCQEPMLRGAMGWVVTLFEETAGLGRHGWHRDLLSCGGYGGASAGNQKSTPVTSQAVPDPGPFPSLLDSAQAKAALLWVVADICLTSGSYDPQRLIGALVDGMNRRGVPRGDAAELLGWLIRGEMGLSQREQIDYSSTVVAGYSPHGKPYLNYRHYITLDVDIEALRRALASPPAEAAARQVAPRRKCGAAADRKTEARNKWIYQQCCKGKEMPHDKIVAELKKLAAKRGWLIVRTKQRIQQIGKEYAEAHGLEAPPARKD
jgi:hypothetical protein